MRIDDELVVIEFARGEAGVVGQLTERLRGVIDSEDADDPTLARLFPEAYPDDGLASAEFRRFTANDLRDGKLADLDLVDEMVGDAGLESAPTTVLLNAYSAERWLRALNDLRLDLGTRMGLRSDDDEPASHPFGLVYQWLTELQWNLTEALDTVDARRRVNESGDSEID